MGISRVLRNSWEVFKKGWKFQLVSLLLMVVVMLPGMFGLVASTVNPMNVNSLVACISLFWIVFVCLWYGAMMTKGILKLIREGNVSIHDITHLLGETRKYIIPLFGLSLVLTIFIMIGFILLIVPGIIIALMCYLSSILMIDKDLSISESLKESNRLTQGRKGEIFVILFVTQLIASAISQGVQNLDSGAILLVFAFVQMGYSLYLQIIPMEIYCEIMEEENIKYGEENKLDNHFDSEYKNELSSKEGEL